MQQQKDGDLHDGIHVDKRISQNTITDSQLSNRVEYRDFT